MSTEVTRASFRDSKLSLRSSKGGSLRVPDSRPLFCDAPGERPLTMINSGELGDEMTHVLQISALRESALRRMRASSGRSSRSLSGPALVRKPAESSKADEGEASTLQLARACLGSAEPIGELKIAKLLGHGRLASVYVVIERSAHGVAGNHIKSYALKVTSNQCTTDHLEAFAEEAFIQRELNHDCLVSS